MKTIIASLKAQIEATKKSIEIHENAVKELWNDLFASGKNGASEDTLKEVAKRHQEASDELRKAEYKLSCLRSALISVRQANGDSALGDFDTFAPELSC